MWGRVISTLRGPFDNLLHIYLRVLLSGIHGIITIKYFKQYLEYSKHSISVTYKNKKRGKNRTVKIANAKSISRTTKMCIEHHFPKCAMSAGVIENKHFCNGMNWGNNLFNSV